MRSTAIGRDGHGRPRGLQVALGAVLLLCALPGIASAAPPLERIVIRTHQVEYTQVVTDDVCGDVAGGQGLRSGTFSLVETNSTKIWIYEDMFHLVDVENGTYSYDFDDPTIPDVSGYRNTSPTQFILTKSGNENLVENQVEFLPGVPGGIRIHFRLNVHWRDGVPYVEREYFNVTGCP